ncbi:MAG: glycosyltransferase family A protein [Desulfocapsaceae bacterium]|nr:glycosyltransferase family A protein [Desulfocapsaceae bacterium]
MGKESRELVSVIIPTYNRAQKCKAAVESVLSQSYDNVEIIVVDDGSNDDTKEIICGLDFNIKYIFQCNAGVSAARNTGLKAASGDYIAFLDSDDVWLPWKLEAQLRVLQAFPKAGMIWTDMTAVNENGLILHTSYLKRMYGAYEFFDCDKQFAKRRELSEIWKECPAAYANVKCYTGNIFSWMFMGNLVHTSTVLLRRKCQEKVGLFDLDLIRSGEDYDFHFRTCRVSEVVYLDMPSIHYQVGAEDQLTERKYKVWIARNNLITLKKMLSVARNEICLPRHMIKEHLAWSYAWVGFTEFDEHQRTRARIHFWQSLRLSPFQVKIIIFLILTFLPTRMSEGMRELKKSLMK